MEGAHFIKTSSLIKLSEQQCLDCADGALGCRGGGQIDCFSYAEDEAIDKEADYPYTGYKDSCWDKPNGPVRLTTYKSV